MHAHLCFTQIKCQVRKSPSPPTEEYPNRGRQREKAAAKSRKGIKMDALLTECEHLFDINTFGTTHCKLRKKYIHVNFV